MQHLWQEEANARAISQITPPDEVVDFILKQPGLREVSEFMPDVLVEFVPQLAIPGFAGPLEPAIQTAYEASIRKCAARRSATSTFGSGLTTNSQSPACSEKFALRHPTFGDYRSSSVACSFVQGDGFIGPGPNVKAYDHIDYLVWLLSCDSDWLPRGVHEYLLRGMKEWAVWPWTPGSRESNYEGEAAGEFTIWLTSSEKRRRVKPSTIAMTDLRDRIIHTRQLLHLSEDPEELIERFLSEAVIDTWFDVQRERRARRRRSV